MGRLPARFAALHILDSDPGLTNSLNQFLRFSLDQLPDVQAALFKAKRYLEEQGFFEEKLMGHPLRPARWLWPGISAANPSVPLRSAVTETESWIGSLPENGRESPLCCSF